MRTSLTSHGDQARFNSKFAKLKFQRQGDSVGSQEEFALMVEYDGKTTSGDVKEEVKEVEPQKKEELDESEILS